METSQGTQLVYKNTIGSTSNTTINSNILIPYYSLYSDRIVVHPRPFANITKRKVSGNSLKNLKKKKFTGNISKSQRALIKKKLTSWLDCLQAKNLSVHGHMQHHSRFPVFITVTLSSTQKHDDKEIKRKILDNFIKALKTKFGVKYYFWKAERQRNGNIHFHLIVDKYCKWNELQIEWNRCQNVLGYINEFEKKHKHRQPNSVDVRSAKDVTNFVNYVLKYCLKEGEGKAIEGRVFGMSDELRKLSVFQDVVDSSLGEYLQKYIDHNYFNVYRQDYYTVITFKKEFYGSVFYNLLQKKSRSYYLDVYNDLYGKKVEKLAKLNEFKERLITRNLQLELFSLDEQISVINSYNYINKKANAKYRKIGSCLCK